MSDYPTAEVLRDFMLELLDQSPDRLAVVAISLGDDIDELDAIVIAGFDLAKAERPDLGVKVAPGLDPEGDEALLMAVHQHSWIGGECLHGCGEQRPVDDEAEAA